MDTPVGAFAVANHWRFIARHLELAHWRTAERALRTLAELQVEAGGEPVTIGGSRLRGLGMTAGEAGGVWRAMVELEERLVVFRNRGRGRRPDAWSFRPAVAQWRGVPWRSSGRSVESALWACGCIAQRDFAARSPGQGTAKPRVMWLSADDHFRLPGLSLVETRWNDAPRAANTHGRAWEPVDSRGNETPPGTPIPLYLELDEEEEKRFDEIVGGVRAAARGAWVFGAPKGQLQQIARELDLTQARSLRDELKSMAPPPGTAAPSVATVVSEIPDILRRLRNRASRAVAIP